MIADPFIESVLTKTNFSEADMAALGNSLVTSTLERRNN